LALFPDQWIQLRVDLTFDVLPAVVFMDKVVANCGHLIVRAQQRNKVFLLSQALELSSCIDKGKFE
jgi:hypothetical protein